MRVLITGSQGMLGRRLSELLSGDMELYGCGRSKPSADLDYIYDSVDLTNFSATKKILTTIQPEVIFHLAAKTQVDDCELKPKEAWENNSLATQNLLNASQKFNPIIFYLSSDYVFDGKKSTPYRVTDPVNPVSVYGRTKAEGESWVKRLSQRWFIVRTSWLYGADGPNFVDSILRIAGEKNELRVVKDQIGRPTSTRDLAEALHTILKGTLLLSKIPYGIYHFSNRGDVSWFDFAKKILEYANLKNQVTAITSKELNRPAPRPHFSLLDLSPIIKMWGIQPILWQESLKKYMREKGALSESNLRAA